MNKVIGVLLFVVSVSILAGFVSAATGECNLAVSIVNQDPVHAVPGEYVDVIFQVSGIENPSCGTVEFGINPQYPFSLDPGAVASKVIQSGTFTSTYNSQATIPFTLRVDKDALDNNYGLEADYSTDRTGGNLKVQKNFNISVKDVRTKFDVFVSDYVAATNTITFGIVNTGKYDVEALTVDLLKQNSLDVKGSTKAIIGTLDANQDTTFTFEGIPSSGNISMNIMYNDANGERRSVTKEVAYDPSYFTGRVGDAKTTSTWTYVLGIVIILVIIWIVRKIFFKKNKHHQN